MDQLSPSTEELTIDQALQLAVDHHRSGRLLDAEKLYRAILQVQPKHPDANHNIGVLAVGVGQTAAALPFFKAALEANSQHGQFWLSYIDALMRVGQTDNARQVIATARSHGLQDEALGKFDAQLPPTVEKADSSPLTPTVNTHDGMDPLAPAIAARESGRYAEAITWLDQWLTAHANDTAALALFTHVLLLDKQDDRAAVVIQRAIQIAPDSPPVQRNHARLLLKRQQSEAALQTAQAAQRADSDNPESWLLLAAALGANQRDAEALPLINRALQARPNYAEAFANRALLKLRAKDPSGALADAEQALTLKPHLTQVWALTASLRYQARNLPGAIAALRKAQELEPGNVGYMVDLGEFLRQNNQVDAAIALLAKATATDPGKYTAWVNYGTALQEAGRIDEAKAAYTQALAIQPQSAEIASNLGLLAKNEGNWEEAEARFRQAIALNPDFAEAHSNLGSTLSDLGRLEEAEAIYRQAIAIKPHYSQAKKAYAQCVGSMRFTSIPSAIYSTIATALSEVWDRPSTLSGVACNLLLLNPTIKKHAVPDSYTGLNFVSELFDADSFEKLGNDALLLALLTSAPVSDPQVERLLTHARLAFLDGLSRPSGEGCDFASGRVLFCALAQQCFINEYVFSAADEEIQKATRLKVMLENALKRESDISPLWVMGTACYFPLYSVEDSEALLKRTWPSEIKALLIQQIEEPLEELRLRSSIPLLTQITNGVSAAVHGQYEENPYPRWVKVPKESEPKLIDVFLQQKFPYVNILPIENYRSPDILIAGCGTGQHPIQTAQCFRDARVLAIDLSASSLSYAKRKSHELGIVNIDYAQADILNLGSIGRTFDLIESAGVLHHLERPFDGWRLLVSLLRPNGLMMLGFYSEIARRDIVKTRHLIKQNHIGSTPSDIRKARQWLLEIDRTDSLGRAVRSADFYSLSACRDLLFHVQEHRMTLEQINGFIEENNLTFIGFEIRNPTVKRAYMSRFPGDRAATNLRNWQLFEQENPDIFFGMYQFWVQKQR